MSEIIYGTEVDKAANLFHELWVEWTKTLSREQYYDIPNHIRNHWAVNWIPYDKLSEKEKETDRIIARRFLELLAR